MIAPIPTAPIGTASPSCPTTPVSTAPRIGIVAFETTIESDNDEINHWRHAMGNALIPVITVVGLYLGILIGNSVLTEIVFNRPGLGKLIVGALGQRDYTMLQGLMVIYTFIIVIVNLLTDLTYGLVDPRVKYQ